MKISIIVQFGTGIGHLARISAIANELKTFAEVTIFSGGRPVDFRFDEAIHFVQLPAMYWDSLPGAVLKPVDPAWSTHKCLEERSRILVEAYRTHRPDIVITEYFPFGPGRFGSTLDGLLDEIRNSFPRPLLLCSIRSFPQLMSIRPQVSPEWVRRILLENYDGILHHADAEIFPISSLGSYFISALREMPVYQTGFVRKPILTRATEQPKGTLFTVGGGNSNGAELMKKWLDSTKFISSELHPVHAVLGPLMPEKYKSSLREAKPPGVLLYDSVSNLDDLLLQCRAVVCMGGYNTLIEAISMQKPVLSFQSGQHEDQHFQINRFAKRGLLLKGDARWTSKRIANEIDSLIYFYPREQIKVNGASKTAEIIMKLVSTDLRPVV